MTPEEERGADIATMTKDTRDALNKGHETVWLIMNLLCGESNRNPALQEKRNSLLDEMGEIRMNAYELTRVLVELARILGVEA